MKRLLIFGSIFLVFALLIWKLPAFFDRPAPGEGGAARSGKRLCDFAIAVLEKYHELNGHYPAALSDVTSIFSPGTQQKLDALHPDYSLYGDGFHLSFTVDEDGEAVQCVWASEKNSWSCREDSL